LEDKCRPFFVDWKESDPWVKSRRANIERDGKLLDYWSYHRGNCLSWKAISDLMLETDEETYQYVLRQLCRKLGNTKFLVRPRPPKKKKATETKETKKSELSKIMATLQKGLSKKASKNSKKTQENSNQSPSLP
jgi:hypothetical protein